MKKPKNLSQAVQYLLDTHGSDMAMKMAIDHIDFSTQQHHSMGRWIRNNWLLGQTGPLFDDLRSRGLYHTDDMSTVILSAAWCAWKGVEYDMEEDIRKFDEHWAKFSTPH